MQFRHFRPGTSQESGVYLIVATAIIAALLAFAALTIDAARLYWAKRQLQAAVDAAVVAGGNILATRPAIAVTGNGPVSAESLTREIIKENLLRMKFSQALADNSSANAVICFGPTYTLSSGCPATPPTNPSDLLRGIRATAQLNQPTLLVGFIPGAASFTTLTATSVVQNLRLRVALVLDESFSMGQSLPFPGPHPAGLNCANPSDCKRMEGLKYAANYFLGTLLPFDTVGLVKFSLNYTPSGGHWANDYTPSTDDEYWQNYDNDAYVFAPLTQIVDQHNVSQLPTLRSAINDLTPYSNTDIGAGIRAGREMILHPPSPMLAPQADELPVIILVTDGAPIILHPDREQTFLTRYDSGPSQITSLCARYPGRTLPYLSFFGLGSELNQFPRSENWEDNGNPPTHPNILRRRFNTIDAIEDADLALDSGILIYTIGLGAHDTVLGSPFQGLGDLQHPLLLHRLANDQTLLKSPPTELLPAGFSGDPSYFWDFPCVKSGRDLVARPVGKYFDVTTGTALTQAFRDIAGQIRGKLAQ